MTWYINQCLEIPILRFDDTFGEPLDNGDISSPESVDPEQSTVATRKLRGSRTPISWPCHSNILHQYSVLHFLQSEQPS